MDNPTDTLDQADEEILTPTVSDEALERTAEGIEQLRHWRVQRALNQTDEEILTDTVSDEALEAAAEMGAFTQTFPCFCCMPNTVRGPLTACSI
jgi:hypothetical protein